MMIVEDGTIVADANSLVSLSDANAIMFNDPYRSPVWSSVTDEMKEKLLIFATRYVDLSYRFGGLRVSVDQTLPFPRKNLINFETGYPFPDNVIPPRVKQAIVEVALWFLERGSSSFAEVDDVTMFRTEDVEIAFDPKSRKDILPIVVTRLLNGLAEFMGGDVTSWKIRKS